MDIDRMAEEMDEAPRLPVRVRHRSSHGPGGGQASGSQVSERSLAADPGPPAVREKSNEEQEGFYGSRKPRMLGEPYVPTQAEREEHEKSHLPLEVMVRLVL